MGGYFYVGSSGSGMRGTDWIDLAQDRQVAGTFQRGDEPSGSYTVGSFSTNLEPVSCSRRTLVLGVI
jgi:hypothetical protein